ncbi:MAG: hypothetical protein ACFFD4_39730 [Candidatus Odinarchaeota archaeon]
MFDLKEQEYLLLYKMMKINEPRNTTELASALKVSINTVKGHLGRLEIIKFVTSKRKGKEIKWTITADGNSFIEEYIETEVGKARLVIWEAEDLISR